MFSHVTIGTNDLARAGIFYDAVFAPLGLSQRRVKPDGGPVSLCWILPNQRLPGFYVYQPYNKQAASPGNGVMIAFNAPSPKAVDLAYKAGMKTGGVCEGEPGERAHYGQGYYGAYLRDPDGNKIHIAFRGDIET